MQFSIEKFKFHSNELQQTYKCAQEYVRDRALSAKQKIDKGARFLAQMIARYAFQIYTYVQNATHRLLPSRVHIINLKEWIFKTPRQAETPVIQETIEQPFNDSKIPSLETTEEAIEINRTTLETMMREVTPDMVSTNVNTPKTEQQNENNEENGLLFMAAILTTAVAMKAFKRRGGQEKPKLKPPLSERATTSEEQMSKPSSNRPTDTKLPRVDIQLASINPAASDNPPSDVMANQNPNNIFAEQTQNQEDSKFNSEPYLLEGATTSQQLLPEPSSNRVIYGRPSPVETELAPILLPEPDKLQSNKPIYQVDGIRKANREGGTQFMNNPFENHTNRLVPWQTIMNRPKPIPDNEICKPSLLNRFNLQKYGKAILLSSLKPRM